MSTRARERGAWRVSLGRRSGRGTVERVRVGRVERVRAREWCAVLCERARDCMGSRCGRALPCGECDVSHTCTFPAQDVLHIIGVSVRTPV